MGLGYDHYNCTYNFQVYRLMPREDERLGVKKYHQFDLIEIDSFKRYHERNFIESNRDRKNYF